MPAMKQTKPERGSVQGHTDLTYWEFSPLSLPPTASLKSFGEKTASLFDRKKKDAEKLAADKAAEAQKIAEEQARKVGEEIGKTKSEAEALAASTGEDCWGECYWLLGNKKERNSGHLFGKKVLVKFP